MRRCLSWPPRLDGSRLAEAALPAASFLAGKLGARVTLLHVIERDAPREIHGERHLSEPDEAADYLDEIADRAFPPGTEIEKHVHGEESSDVARSIADHIAEREADLIVMCTHGRGGLRGWMFGRIAQQVVNRGSKPVLLVQPSGAEAVPAFSCRRLLVALDGNPEHERGLKISACLAKACGADLRLVMVVHYTSTLSGEQAATARILPRATSALLDIAEKEAHEYLRRHVAELESAGLAATAEVRRGDPVPMILNTAEQSAADLIVLATHGKTGMDAFWAGSATPNVTGRSPIPLLLVPVSGKAPTQLPADAFRRDND
jgi:nucleotide-binding universal stress UspA family protein